jgi:hypothetical protein
MKVCVVGASGKLGRYMVRHALSTGTAQAVLDHAPPEARLVFSCGWHITRDGLDVYPWKLRVLVSVFGRLASGNPNGHGGM